METLQMLRVATTISCRQEGAWRKEAGHNQRSSKARQNPEKTTCVGTCNRGLNIKLSGCWRVQVVSFAIWEDTAKIIEYMRKMCPVMS